MLEINLTRRTSMSFYRTLLATVAAVALATPAFAADDTSTQGNNETTTTTTTQTTTQSKVNINTASAKELMKVKGINAAKARDIVAYRKAHGDFKSTDDLSNVKSFKKMKPEALKKVQDQLSTE